MAIAEQYGFSASFEPVLLHRVISSKEVWGAIGKWLEPEYLHGDVAKYILRAAKACAHDSGGAPEGVLQVVQRAARIHLEGRATAELFNEVMPYFDVASRLGAPYTDRAIIGEAVGPLKRTANVLLLKQHAEAISKHEQDYATRLQMGLLELEKIGVYARSDGVGTDTDLNSLWGQLDMPRFSTGSLVLDTMMMGGFVCPGLGIYVAGPGAGKSRKLVQTTCANLFLGHDVIIGTLELPETVWNALIIGCLTNVATRPLIEAKHPDASAARAEASRRFKLLLETRSVGRWWIQHHAAGTSVKGFLAWKDQIAREKKLNPRVVVSDYADKFGTGNNDKAYQSVQVIYDTLRDDALAGNYLHASASQPKRADKPRPIIDEDDLADSQHKIRIVEAAVSLNVELSTDGAPASNYAKYFVIKDRYGESKVLSSAVQMNRAMGSFTELDGVRRPIEFPPFRGVRGIV